MVRKGRNTMGLRKALPYSVQKWFVVVDGKEGKEYDGFLRGSELVFDSPKSFHTLAFRGIEIFRVEVQIETAP